MQPTARHCGREERSAIPRRPENHRARSDRDVPRAAEHRRGAAPSALKRFVHTVAVRLTPKPDLSLMNEKFTDSFERERTHRMLRNRW